MENKEIERIESTDFWQEVFAQDELNGNTFWKDVFKDLKESNG